jgi:hypothetical protein
VNPLVKSRTMTESYNLKQNTIHVKTLNLDSDQPKGQKIRLKEKEHDSD